MSRTVSPLAGLRAVVNDHDLRQRFCGVCHRVRGEWDLMVRPKPRPSQQLYGNALQGGHAPHAEMLLWPLETTLATYRISRSTFVAMYEEQNGRCAICKTKPEHPAGLLIDHNHKTGKVRGLLCAGCNTGLGHLKDSPDVLEAAMQYLEERGCYGPDALAEEASRVG